MVAAYSRFIAAMMIPSKVTRDLLAGMWLLLSTCIGGVPRTLLWDNEAGIGQRGRLAQGVTGFCGVLGTRLVQAPTLRPGKQGRRRADQPVSGHVVSARADLRFGSGFLHPADALADRQSQSASPCRHPRRARSSVGGGSGRDG